MEIPKLGGIYLSKSIFESMKTSLDELVQGRKYLITSIEKIKKEMPNLTPSLQQLTVALEGLEAFIPLAQKLEGRIDGIQAGITSINNMAVSMENLRSEIQSVNNNYLSFKPMLESIKQSAERQDQALASMNQNIQQLGTLMGNILAKLG